MVSHLICYEEMAQEAFGPLCEAAGYTYVWINHEGLWEVTLYRGNRYVYTVESERGLHHGFARAANYILGSGCP